jgi:hypothetical protein
MEREMDRESVSLKISKNEIHSDWNKKWWTAVEEILKNDARTSQHMQVWRCNACLCLLMWICFIIFQNEPTRVNPLMWTWISIFRVCEWISCRCTELSDIKLHLFRSAYTTTVMFKILILFKNISWW